MNESGLRWIIIPPSSSQADWRSAIKAEAALRGLLARDWTTGEELNDAHIALTDDLDGALAAGANHNDVTVLALPPFIDLGGCEETVHIHARVEAVSRRITAAYGFSGRVVRDLAGEVDLPHLPGFSVPAERSAASQHPTPKEAALSEAAQIFLSGRANWPTGLFTYDQRNAVSGPATGRMNVTGRPRFLFSGPYLVMPAGAWEAKIILSFDRDVGYRRFRLDWGGVTDYTTYEFTPGRSGFFEVSLNYAWDKPAPAELRLLVLEGVFHGSVVFGGAAVRRI